MHLRAFYNTSQEMHQSMTTVSHGDLLTSFSIEISSLIYKQNSYTPGETFVFFSNLLEVTSLGIFAKTFIFLTVTSFVMGGSRRDFVKLYAFFT